MKKAAGDTAAQPENVEGYPHEGERDRKYHEFERKNLRKSNKTYF